jgi:hypothetical protein
MAFLRWHTEQRNFLLCEPIVYMHAWLCFNVVCWVTMRKGQTHIVESTECALCAWKGVKVAESTEYRFGVF